MTAPSKPTGLPWPQLPPLETIRRQIAQASPKLYTSSRTRPGVVYQLRFVGDGWRCTCPGYGYRGTCRHVTALAAFRPTPPSLP